MCAVTGTWLGLRKAHASVELVEPQNGAHSSTEDVERPKTFVEKVRQLGYAPRELYIIFSIKFAESTAYYAFSYVYTAFLSDEFGFSDVEAGVLYTLYGLLCSAIGLLVGPMIDALDLRTSLLLGTIPSFIGRFGSAVTRDRAFVSMCSYALLPLGAAFGMPVRRPRSAVAAVAGRALTACVACLHRRSSLWACVASRTPRTAPLPSRSSTRSCVSPR